MNEWIKTDEQLPPIGQWVLVVDANNRQKPWEIMKYDGIFERTGWDAEKGDFTYEVPNWISGDGGVLNKNPVAWLPLPTPYKAQ